jgi:predicted glycosyltransferase
MSTASSERLLVAIQHPAHVHFYKHAIRELQGEYEISIVVRESEVATDLLDAYGFEYEVLGKSGSGIRLIAAQVLYEAKMLRHTREFEPDVMTAIGGSAVAHVARTIGAKSVVFTDTEHATLTNKLMSPFADEIWTPECFHADFGAKQVRYPGYHELAYLHPDRFSPDETIREEVGLGADEKYVVLRLVSWEASHDAGAGGIDDVGEVVDRLEATGTTVLITAEGDIPSRVRNRQVEIAPHRMHDLLAGAVLFVGEGATMAAESAVLGTPAVYVNTLRMGYTDELEARYNLLYNCQGAYRHEMAVDIAEAILSGETAHDWTDERNRLLEENVDTTNVILRALTGDGTY